MVKKVWKVWTTSGIFCEKNYDILSEYPDVFRIKEQTEIIIKKIKGIFWFGKFIGLTKEKETKRYEVNTVLLINKKDFICAKRVISNE